MGRDMPIYPSTRAFPHRARTPHPTPHRAIVQTVVPVQWVGQAAPLTPKPVPSGFCPDRQSLAGGPPDSTNAGEGRRHRLGRWSPRWGRLALRVG